MRKKRKVRKARKSAKKSARLISDKEMRSYQKSVNSAISKALDIEQRMALKADKASAGIKPSWE